jgi:hypothetical protein
VSLRYTTVLAPIELFGGLVEYTVPSSGISAVVKGEVFLNMISWLQSLQNNGFVQVKTTCPSPGVPLKFVGLSGE